MGRRIVKKEELEYIKNRKGKNSIRWKGYTYTLNSEKGGTQYWRCSKRPCPARINVNQNIEQYCEGKKLHNCCPCEDGDGDTESLGFSEEASEGDDEMAVQVYNQQKLPSQIYKDPLSVVVSNSNEFRTQERLAVHPTQTTSAEHKSTQYDDHNPPISSVASNTTVFEELKHSAVLAASSKSNKSVCVERPMELENCAAAANTASVPIAGASGPNPSNSLDVSQHSNSGNAWPTSSVASSQDCTTQDYYKSIVTGRTSPAIATSSSAQENNELREIFEQFQPSPNDTIQEEKTIYEPFFALNEHTFDPLDAPSSTSIPLTPTQGFQGTSQDVIMYQSSALLNKGAFDAPSSAPMEESGHYSGSINNLATSSSTLVSQMLRDELVTSRTQPSSTSWMSNPPVARTHGGIEMLTGQFRATSQQPSQMYYQHQDRLQGMSQGSQCHHPPQQQVPMTYPHLQQGHQPQAPPITHQAPSTVRNKCSFATPTPSPALVEGSGHYSYSGHGSNMATSSSPFISQRPQDEPTSSGTQPLYAQGIPQGVHYPTQHQVPATYPHPHPQQGHQPQAPAYAQQAPSTVHNNGVFDAQTPSLVRMDESGHYNGKISNLATSPSTLTSQILCNGPATSRIQSSSTSWMFDPPVARTHGGIVMSKLTDQSQVVSQQPSQMYYQHHGLQGIPQGGQCHYPPQQQMPMTYPHLQQGHQPQAPPFAHDKVQCVYNNNNYAPSFR